MELSKYHQEWFSSKGIEAALESYPVSSEGDHVVFGYPHSTKRRLVRAHATIGYE